MEKTAVLQTSKQRRENASCQIYVSCHPANEGVSCWILREVPFGLRRVIRAGVIALTAHSASGKPFDSALIESAGNTVSIRNAASSPGLTSVPFQDFGSAFSEVLSESSRVSPNKEEHGFTMSGSKQGTSAPQSKTAASTEKSTGSADEDEPLKPAMNYQGTPGLLAGPWAYSTSESGLTDSETSAASSLGEKFQANPRSLMSEDAPTIIADNSSAQGRFNGRVAATDYGFLVGEQSGNAAGDLKKPSHVPVQAAENSNDGGGDARIQLPDTAATIITGDNATLQDNFKPESAGLMRKSVSAVSPSDFQSAVTTQSNSEAKLQQNMDVALTGRPGDGTPQITSAISSSSKDLEAFNLLLSKTPITDVSERAAQPANIARATEPGSPQPSGNTTANVPTQDSGDLRTDQSDTGDSRREEQGQSAVIPTTMAQKVKSSSAHVVASDDEADPAVGVAGAKTSLIAKADPPATGSEIAASPTRVLTPAVLTASAKEDTQKPQSYGDNTPTNLQGSSGTTLMKEVVVKIQGQSGETISVRLVDQGGQVQVGVRSTDPSTAASLRQDLSSLASNLERSGWKTETTSLIPEAVLSAGNSKSGSDDPESSSKNYNPEWQEQSGKRKQTPADLWDETLDRQSS